MYESRKTIWVSVFVLLFGLAVGMAHADNGSTDGMNLDTRNQPVTEDLVAEDLVADVDSDSSVTADPEIPEPAVEPGCAADTALTTALGMETALSASTFAWTCGSCSVSACANRPVGTSCGIGKYCVVSIMCMADLRDKCVCGTDHF